jgi:hypothetical protein
LHCQLYKTKAMQTQTKRILTFLHILSWILFVGVCIKTGALLFSFFVSRFINPVAALDLHLGLNLSDLMSYSIVHYTNLVILLIITWAIRAYILYLVIQLYRKTNLVHPFSSDVAVLIKRISYVSLALGAFILMGKLYSNWLAGHGVALNNLHEYLEGAAECFLMGGIIYFIAQVFNKGIEIQTENELTV